MSRTASRLASTLALLMLLDMPAMAQKAYDRGANDMETKIGNLAPYSGPGSSYGVTAKAEAAYFRMINESGGINGRRINFISYDDAFLPPKAVEQVRKLVEVDEVLLVFQSLGTPSDVAIQKYLNQRKVPHLFVGPGATRWGDPRSFPWTMGWQPNYQSEGRICAKYVLDHYPSSKIAVFYQNDDSGKDQVKGLQDGLGSKVGMIVAEKSYDVADPTPDSQIVALRDSRADILFAWVGPKGAAQAIKKVSELAWKPKLFFVANVSTSVASVMNAAGSEASKGVISSAYLKDPTDPAWKDNADVKEWQAFMDKWYPGGDKTNSNNVYAYAVAQTLAQVLKQCGDDLTRENVMKQAANLRDFAPKMLLPGIKINTAPDDFYPIEQMQLMRFDGQGWQLFGDVITGEVGHMIAR